MDELSINRTFVNVVEHGSFSAAARVLDMSVTSVARQVSSLETMLGIRLLNRTTRRQSLTDAGQNYFGEITNILTRMDLLKREMTAHQIAVRGSIKVHLRSSIGNQVIVPALPRFLEKYPDLSLDVTLTDEREDLVKLGVDLAVWLGELEDSSLVARRLSPGRRVLCASPQYLDRHGFPQVPDDLADHNCLVFSAVNYGSPWRFTKDGVCTPVHISGNLRTGSGAVLMASALNGLGLVMLQNAMVRDAVDDGRLVRVLPDYEVSPTALETGLYAVFPSARLLSPKTRLLIDYLVDLFKAEQ